jgi:8-oxo-dGTP pyrophosphatase MutT (NUDIX family)
VTVTDVLVGRIMKRNLWQIVLFSLLLQVLPAHAQSGIEAAGVLAFTRIQGITYVLLADHRGSDRGWGTFGGHREEGESPEDTAWREFIEETRCIYRDLPRVDLTEAPRVTHGPYVSYVIEVPYVPAQVFASAPPPPECRTLAFNERGPWAWFPLDELERILETGKSKGRFHLSPAHVPKGSTDKLWVASAVVIWSSIQGGHLTPLAEPAR